MTAKRAAAALAVFLALLVTTSAAWSSWVSIGRARADLWCRAASMASIQPITRISLAIQPLPEPIMASSAVTMAAGMSSGAATSRCESAVGLSLAPS
jgi:hypothetical protein